MVNWEERLKDLKFSVAVGKNDFTMSRGSFRYKYKIGNFISAEDAGLHLKVEQPAPGWTHICMEGNPGAYNRFCISFPTSPDEHIYGCGETYTTLDLKGEQVRIWVAEHQNTMRITKKILHNAILGRKPQRISPYKSYESYYAQPTFVSSDRYFVHVNTDAFAGFDFSKKDRITLWLEDAPDLIIGQAEDFTEVSHMMTHHLGGQPKLPEWIFDGAILAIQEGPDAIDRRVKAARDAGAQVVGVWSQDWCGCRRTGFGYQVMWNWEYDRELYPDLPEKIQKWHEQGLRFLGYINPFLALEKDLYKEAAEKGYCVKDKEGKDYLVTITTFPAAMIDFTNPDAYAWYKNLIKENMIGIGMDGWMADFGEYLPTDCVLYDGSDPEKIHNRWPAIWARMNREAVRECDKRGEVFFFTRAGHTESTGTSTMMWTGDHHVDWSMDDGMPSVIPATLSLGLSGFGVTHSDIGGYTTIMKMCRTKELLMRWEEMNVFSPLYRFHEGNQPSKNVQFDSDEELLAHLAAMSRLYKNLGWYLKGLVYENAVKGTPVMRPVFYHYDEAWAYTEKTEYLLGEDILSAPVLKEKALSRQVHLPEDTWIHLFTGEEYRGGIFEIDAPVGAPPVFIRKNSPRAERLLAITKNTQK